MQLPVSERGRHLAQAYRARAMRMPVLPVYLSIETTSHCNLACVMCPQPSMKRRKQHMDASLFESIVEQAAGHVDFAWLHLFGEPFLNPGFEHLVCHAREHGDGMRLGTSTNVTLLKGAIAEAAVRLPLDILLLSIDGISAQSYARIRVKGQFDAVLDNVRRFADAWQARAVDGRPQHVVLSFIDLPCIDEDVAAARDFWERLLPREFAVNLKPFHPWADQDDLIARITARVGEVRPRLPRRRRCHEFSRGLTVLSDGRCVPCCNDYEGRLVLGDLTRQTLAEVWNSARMQALRVDEVLDNPLCAFCPQYSPSEDNALLEVSPFQPWNELRGYMSGSA